MAKRTRDKNVFVRRGIVLLLVLVVFASSALTSTPSQLPDGFVYVTDETPDRDSEIRYFSEDNFVGGGH